MNNNKLNIEKVSIEKNNEIPIFVPAYEIEINATAIVRQKVRSRVSGFNALLSQNDRFFQ